MKCPSSWDLEHITVIFSLKNLIKLQNKILINALHKKKNDTDLTFSLIFINLHFLEIISCFWFDMDKTQTHLLKAMLCF